VIGGERLLAGLACEQQVAAFAEADVGLKRSGLIPLGNMGLNFYRERPA